MSEHIEYMSSGMRFPTMWYVQPAKSQISLCIRTVWSEPLQVAWIFCELSYWWNIIWSFQAHRLVWVHTYQNATLLEIKCHGSYKIISLQSETAYKLFV